MLTLSNAVSGLGVAGSLPWIGHLLHLARHRSRAVFLADLGAETPAGGWPSLALVFAARDEAEGVEAAVRSMLAQDYPALEVIAVDDRSVDETGTILDRLALEDERLRVVHVADLPGGWLGKTHALQTGANATRAEWLLFSDADVVFAPWALRRALAFAVAEGLDHLAVGPGIPTESAGERLFLALFGLLYSMYAPLGKLEDRRSRAHAGVGAFNLVRAEAFRGIGGFRRLSLSVDDDMMLAKALKFAGRKPRLLLGDGAVSVRWQVGLGGMVRGLEKNFYAGFGYNPFRALGVGLAVLAVGLGPFAGLFVGPGWARVVCGLGVGSVAAMLAASRRQSRIGWYYAFALPLAALALLVSLARSVALTEARRGVVWRGHLYPLGRLRAHVRVRDAWLREVWRSTR